MNIGPIIAEIAAGGRPGEGRLSGPRVGADAVARDAADGVGRRAARGAATLFPPGDPTLVRRRAWGTPR
jgi:hypothetical protein